MYKCKICGKTFENRVVARRHILSEHVKESYDEPVAKGKVITRLESRALRQSYRKGSLRLSSMIEVV